MSKCEVTIAFDRPDRIYRGGEAVGGKVSLSVNETVNAKGIRLSHRWKTHGRGNIESGPDETITLCGSKLLVAGEQLEFPFELKASCYPVSYHGQIISIDHYVRAEVDVAWARNPSVEEDYILRPGETPPELTGGRGTRVSLKAAPVKLGLIAKVILSIVAMLFLGLIVAFALFLLPIIVVVAVFLWIRSKAVAARVGPVEVSMPHLILAPGEDWPFEISFTPRKSFQVNSITLKITATEAATSGSGSDRKTTQHVLLTRTISLRESCLLIAGEIVHETRSVNFPSLNAFSFEGSDNKITWNAEVRIDIPRFPDWSKSEVLQVVPAEFLGGQLSSSDRAGQSLDSDSEGSSGDREEGDREEGERSGFDREFLASPDSEADDEAPLANSFAQPSTIDEIVSQLESVGRQSAQRNQIIAMVANTSFDVAVVIGRIVTTMGSLNLAKHLSSGKTIVGTVQGTNQAIHIVAAESNNDTLASLRRGDIWETTISINGWDTLYNRINGQTVT